MAIVLDGTAGEQLLGNLTFTGTGQRITGDFSNGTVANRTMLQTTTTNGATQIHAIPNGTRSTGTTTSAFNVEDNNSIATGNGSVGVFSMIQDSGVVVSSGIRGTGTYLPLSFWTNNAEQMRIATDGTITGTKGNLQLISGTAVASTSGTSITFTGIPTWAKRVSVMLSGVSTNGTSPIIIQLGTVSGFEVTGYLSGTLGLTNGNGTVGYIVSNVNAASTIHGNYSVSNISGNQWVGFGSIGYSDNVGGSAGGGSKTLSGTLTQIRVITVNGTDTFDAGSINIMYE